MSNPGAAPAESGAHLPWLTRIAYGLGDTAQNVVWGAMGILTFFYTDYAGIDPAMVGLVMLISRCFDGFSDVIMGFLVERTNSKWGGLGEGHQCGAHGHARRRASLRLPR